MIFLDLSDQTTIEIVSHLLKENKKPAPREQAAFVFVKKIDNENVFSFNSVVYPNDDDYIVRSEEGLALKPEFFHKLYELAVKDNLGVIEFHSHPWSVEAVFSNYDFEELNDHVPSFLWRTSGKPYGAIVVSNIGLDGLIWTKQGESPLQIHSIRTEKQCFLSSGLSINKWRQHG